MEIFNSSLHRILPGWVYDNIERGAYLSRFKYVDGNKFEPFNERFFITDRYEHTSFIGGIAELAWILSHTDVELMYMLPCLTKEEQVEKALDFFFNGKAYQLKMVELGSFGDLQVRYEYLETQADYLVLIDPVNAKAYTHTPAMWDALKQISYRDESRKMFWVSQAAVTGSGGSEKDIPEFIKRAKPPRSIT